MPRKERRQPLDSCLFFQIKCLNVCKYTHISIQIFFFVRATHNKPDFPTTNMQRRKTFSHKHGLDNKIILKVATKIKLRGFAFWFQQLNVYSGPRAEESKGRFRHLGHNLFTSEPSRHSDPFVYFCDSNKEKSDWVCCNWNGPVFLQNCSGQTCFSQVQKPKATNAELYPSLA